jgi:hypothetical protein
MPRINRTERRVTKPKVKLAQAEGAPHPYSSYNYQSMSDSESETSSPITNNNPITNSTVSMAHNESTAATIEIPKGPRPKLSLIHPDDVDPDSISPKDRYIYKINDIRRDRNRERQNNKSENVVEDEATKKSKQEFRKYILDKMVDPENENIYERNLARAILSRIDWEEQKAELEKKIVDFESKRDFYEYYKNDFKDLIYKIDRAKQREKLHYEEYRRHDKNENDSLLELYEKRFKEDMLDARRKGGKTKKRESKRNRKSIRRRK